MLLQHNSEHVTPCKPLGRVTAQLRHTVAQIMGLQHCKVDLMAKHCMLTLKQSLIDKHGAVRHCFSA